MTFLQKVNAIHQLIWYSGSIHQLIWYGGSILIGLLLGLWICP